jgi:hypothetical protein
VGLMCAIGNENMTGQHCNHCKRSQEDFVKGLGEPWKTKEIKNAADHYRNQLLPAAAHLSSKPAGYLGVKSHTMYSIPIHLWGSSILHDELGLVKDWLTRLEKFADCRVERVPTKEVELLELLVIRTSDLEDLLFEREELQLKESIKILEKHLAWIKEEIQGQTVTCMNPSTREPRVIPGRVTEEEQQIMDQISWQITPWHETTKEVADCKRTDNREDDKEIEYDERYKGSDVWKFRVRHQWYLVCKWSGQKSLPWPMSDWPSNHEAAGKQSGDYESTGAEVFACSR